MLNSSARIGSSMVGKSLNATWAVLTRLLQSGFIANRLLSPLPLLQKATGHHCDASAEDDNGKNLVDGRRFSRKARVHFPTLSGTRTIIATVPGALRAVLRCDMIETHRRLRPLSLLPPPQTILFLHRLPLQSVVLPPAGSFPWTLFAG
jgi:hypothetical protein